MLNKILYSIILSLGLAACANQTAPPTATAPQYDAALLVDKWQCLAQPDENTSISSIKTIHANGTGEGQHVIKMNLSEKAVWRFGVDVPIKWRIDGNQYFEKDAAQPKATILPAESQSEALAVKAFEKNNKFFKLKETARQIFEKFEGSEIAAKIIQLNKQSFEIELDKKEQSIRINCQRI